MPPVQYIPVYHNNVTGELFYMIPVAGWPVEAGQSENKPKKEWGRDWKDLQERLKRFPVNPKLRK